MSDKLTLIRPWASISKLNDTSRVAMTVPSHCQKTKECCGPIPGNLHPFPKIVEITLPLIVIWNYPAHKKLTTSHFVATRALCDGPHFVECASLWIWINPFLTYHFWWYLLSLTEFFLWWDVKNEGFIKSWDGACDLNEKTVGFSPIWVVWFHHISTFFLSPGLWLWTSHSQHTSSSLHLPLLSHLCSKAAAGLLTAHVWEFLPGAPQTPKHQEFASPVS